MSQEQRDAVDQILRDAPLDLGGNVEEQRPILEQILTAHPLPQDVLISDGVVGGVPVVDICIEGRNADDVLLFFHGGAYALGSAAMAAGLGAELARRADARVVSVDYRLAPEEPYPAAVEDGLTAYRGLVDGGVPVGRLAVAGESAGAGLALATLLAAKAEGLPQPSAAVLFSPWVDLTLSGESMTAMAQVDPAITGAGLRRRAADYVASADPTDPLVSPVFADLSGLAPMLIQAGSHEVLLDDATRLAARAAAGHVEVVLDITPGVPHVFQAFAPVLEEADEALSRAAAFLHDHSRSEATAA